MTAIADLPSMPTTAAPLIVPGLLTGLGLTKPRVPRWASDPDFIESILAGHIEIPDELIGGSNA